MRRRIVILAAVFCVLMIVAIAIAPGLDLPETTLRAYRSAIVLMLAIALLITLPSHMAASLFVGSAGFAAPERVAPGSPTVPTAVQRC